MTLLALETATDRASVALGTSAEAAIVRTVDGARRHAASLLPMIEEVLAEAGVGLERVTGLALSDGPGSFTGLRVGAAVAKALVHARTLPLFVAPSLLVRARGAVQDTGSVLAVADALRGDLYAAAYRFDRSGITELLAPQVMRPEALAARPFRVDRLVGEVPAAVARALQDCVGLSLEGPPEGIPHARNLLGLVGWPGGARQVEAVERWQPAYGRPAEAQARWETAHGRPLPDSIGSPG